MLVDEAELGAVVEAARLLPAARQAYLEDDFVTNLLLRPFVILDRHRRLPVSKLNVSCATDGCQRPAGSLISGTTSTRRKDKSWKSCPRK